MDPQAPTPQQPNPLPGGPVPDPFTPPAPASDPAAAPFTPPAPADFSQISAAPIGQPTPSPLFTPPTDPATNPGMVAPMATPASPSVGPQVFGADVPGAVPGQPGVMPQSFSQTSAATASKGSGKLKIALIALAGVFVLGGGSAAAYFGVMLPNKPENVLKAAFKNTASQKNVTAKITAEGKADSVAYKSTITTKSNRDKKTLGLDASVTVSGFTFTGEARYVDKSAYVKVGDLSNITDIISSAAGLSSDSADQQYATMITDLSKKVANQWYEVDSTLLKQANADCVLESDISINDSDYKLLADAYEKNPFVAIDSSTSDSVDGKSATKFQLTIDEKKANSYGSDLEKTSLFKKVSECDKSADSSGSGATLDKDVTNELSDSLSGDGKSSFTLWVNKKTKTIARVAFQTDPKDEKSSGMSATIDATFDYSPVIIEKPADSKPITTLISEVMNLYGDQPVLGAKIERLIP